MSENSDAAAALERTRKSYDETPYVSSPLIRFQPGRMAANASWVGLDAPDAATARVLEIGCASGGHLLPLAVAYPRARFLGVDLSPVQIAAGEARRSALGVGNLELKAQSLSEIGAADGTFDFILCHGVYSWIPEPVRDDLMRVIAERLAADGVAMVSFNVLPGWRMFQIARDVMNAHAGALADPAERAARTRALFAALAEQSPQTRSYGAFWRNEAQRMAAGDDGYLAHEIFEDSNAPETFDRFCLRLEAHGLGYLCEASLGADNEASLAPAAAASIRALANGDERARGRYLDIFSGRTFREALIVHAGRSRARAPQALDTLHVIAPRDLEIIEAPDGGGEFIVGEPGGGVRVAGGAVVEAMRRLVQRLPASSRLDDLAPSDGPTRHAVREALAQLASFGHVDLSTQPTPCASVLAERPRAFIVSAADARLGDLTVNLRHAAVKLEPFQRLLLPLLDGVRTKADLLAFTLALAAEGKLKMRGPDGPLAGEAAYRARLEPAIEDCLQGFLRNAMLVEG